MKKWTYALGLALLPIVYVALMFATEQPIEWSVFPMIALISVPICIGLVRMNSSGNKDRTQSPDPKSSMAGNPSLWRRSRLSKTVTALGWTLVVTGAIAGATVIRNYKDFNLAVTAPFMIAWLALGTGLAEIGARLGSEKFPQVRRGFSFGTILFGLALVAISCGIFYLYYHVLFVMPRIVLVGAFLGIPGGILVTAFCFEDVCEYCGEGLKLARPQFASIPQGIWSTLRLGRVREALDQLGPPAPEAKHRLDFWYCPKCRQIALCKPDGEKPFVLQGNTARLLTDLV